MIGTVTTQPEIESAIRTFITDTFLFQGGETLSDTASFLETGLIDSTGILEVVFFLEETFKIKVTDQDMLPENLDSVQRMTAYVQRKLAAARGNAA